MEDRSIMLCQCWGMDFKSVHCQFAWFLNPEKNLEVLHLEELATDFLNWLWHPTQGSHRMKTRTSSHSQCQSIQRMLSIAMHQWETEIFGCHHCPEIQHCQVQGDCHVPMQMKVSAWLLPKHNLMSFGQLFSNALLGWHAWCTIKDSLKISPSVTLQKDPVPSNLNLCLSSRFLTKTSGLQWQVLNPQHELPHICGHFPWVASKCQGQHGMMWIFPFLCTWTIHCAISVPRSKVQTKPHASTIGVLPLLQTQVQPWC